MRCRRRQVIHPNDVDLFVIAQLVVLSRHSPSPGFFPRSCSAAFFYERTRPPKIIMPTAIRMIATGVATRMSAMAVSWLAGSRSITTISGPPPFSEYPYQTNYSTLGVLQKGWPPVEPALARMIGINRPRRAKYRLPERT